MAVCSLVHTLQLLPLALLQPHVGLVQRLEQRVHQPARRGGSRPGACTRLTTPLAGQRHCVGSL